MKRKKCLRCGKIISGHPNRKRCEPCAAYLRMRPASTLSPGQQAMARSLAGTIGQNALAERVGVSRANLIRWARDAKVSLDAHSYKPEVIRKVLRYYEAYGKKATTEAFPEVSVRSIVERNYGRFSPRKIRWSDDQIVEAARMAGLVSPTAQARFFNRPGAHEGAIKSLWMKKFGYGAGNINGMPHWYARSLITGTKARYIRPIGIGRDGSPTQFIRLMLWVDLEKHLKSDVAPFIRDAIKTMADFQRWLHDSNDPRPKILRMINEREVCT